jgi:flagellar biosynthetic protein FliR
VLEAAIGFTEREFLLFFLVLVRMTGLFILAPLFGHASIPAQSKAGLAFACTLIVYPMAIRAPFEMPADVYELASFIARELFVGAVIGFVALLVFAAAQYGGEMIDTQIGFSLANIVDPSFGQQVSLLGQFHYLLAMMVYLAVDGHHYLIGALMRSYSAIPMGQAGLAPELFSLVLARFSDLFVITLRMALPPVACLLITEIALGVLARSVPQMNVLMVGFPAKIAVGLVVVGLAITGFVGYFASVTAGLRKVIAGLIRAL